MSILDRLMGRDEPQPQPAARPAAAGGFATAPTAAMGRRGQTPPRADEQALARYRYMLQTAPPEAIEQAHEEAFARLTPDQRRLLLQQLGQSAPQSERAYAQDDPRSLARLATRAEMRQPGFMERTFGGMGGGAMMGGAGMGMGGLIAGGLLSSIAGSFIGSAIAHQFFSDPQVINNFYQTNPDRAAGADNANMGDNSALGLDESASSDFANGDMTVADASGGMDAGFGGDTFGLDAGGDLGSDFGGGDF